MVRLALACLLSIGILAVLLPNTTLPRVHRSEASVIAKVDSSVITRAEFEEYGAVFVLPDGRSLLSDNYVLLALINQELVLQEAALRGISVSPEAVEARVAGAAELDVMERTLRQSGDEAFRRRIETKLLLDTIRARVTSDIQPSEAAMRRYFTDHRDEYPLAEFGEVRQQVADALRAEMVADAWRIWLAGKRACATIKVLDPALQLPPETFEHACVGP